MRKKKIINNDLLLAITLFQNKHPYTEILSINKEKYIDFTTNKYFDVFIFKTNKNIVKIRVDDTINKLF